MWVLNYKKLIEQRQLKPYGKRIMTEEDHSMPESLAENYMRYSCLTPPEENSKLNTELSTLLT